MSLSSAVDALEAKVGINNSAVITSFDFMLKQGRLTSQQPGGGAGSIAFLLDTTNAHLGADSLLSFRSAGVERFRLGGGSGTTTYVELGGGSFAVPGVLGSGRLRYNEATNKWQISENGGAFVDIGASGLTMQAAYTGGETITTTAADNGPLLITNGSTTLTHAVLFARDTNTNPGRTEALVRVEDANVGTAIAGRFQRSSVNGAALRAERTAAGDAVWESGLIAGSTITARIFGDGRAIFGGSAAVGAERVRVTGGTTMLDFTSTTALTVAQTGGGDPTLIVDTTNKRVGIGAAPGAFSLDVTGPTRINGKLTVTGAIDPTDITLSGGVTAHFMQYGAGSTATAGVGGAGATAIMRFRYNEATNRAQVALNGVAYVDIVTGAGGADSLQTAYDTGSTITTDATGLVGFTRAALHPPGVGSQLLTFTDANVVADRTLALLDISDTNVPVTDPDAPSLRITRSQTSGQVAIHLARTGTALGPGAQAPSSKLQLSASIWDGAAAQTRTYSLLNSVTVAAESATNVAARVTLMHGTTAMVDFYPRDLVGATATLVISPRTAAGVVPALTLRARGAYATNGPLLSVENADNANNQIMKLAVGALDLKVQDNVAIGYRLNLALVKNLGLGVDNDEGGSVYFQSPDSAGTLRDIAQVRGATVTAAAATLRGRLELYAATQGALNVLLAEVMGDTAGATATRAGLIVRSRVTAASTAIPFTFRAEASIADANVLARWQDTDTTTLAELRGGGNWMALGSLGVGFVTGSPNARVDIDGDIAYRVVSPAALAAGNNNDYAGAAGRSFARLTPDAGLGSTITGIAGGQNGRILIIVNLGAQTLVIANANGNSVAANQILTGTGDVSLGIGDSITLIYDSVTSRWRRIASAA